MQSSNSGNLKFPLGSYNGYTELIKCRISIIIDLIRENKIKEAEKGIATLALELIYEIEKNYLKAETADKYFTLLDIVIGDNFPEIEFSEEIKNIIIEGMTLHDLGSSFGPNLVDLKESIKAFNDTK
ncbi:MAG: hypothetical protein V1747_07055 [Candidatus Omnitrophota bacterium]